LKIPNSNHKIIKKVCAFCDTKMLIDTLDFQRPLNKWYFRKDRYFSRDLQSTISGGYFLMVVDFQGTQKTKALKTWYRRC